MTETTGWLFDVYPSSEGMVVWLLDDEGKSTAFVDRYEPYFYASGSREGLRLLRQRLSRIKVPIRTERVERTEFWSGRPLEVLKVSTPNLLAYGHLARVAGRLEGIELFNCDIPLPQVYLFERNVFPLARCRLDCDTEGRIGAMEALDSPWSTNYAIPPLRVMELRVEGGGVNPNHSRRGRLEVELDGATYTLEPDDPAELIHTFNSLLESHDPDLIITEWGDSFIIPRLMSLSGAAGVPLLLNRDPRKQKVASRRARSYFTYGKTVYQAGARTLFGRWHVDRCNSFILGEAGLEGLFELARIAKIPVQRTARTSTGTCISNMQMERAVRDGILIPWRKRRAEEFKTGLELLTADKGGLTYQPVLGVHENVAEIDFSSMYPTIMATYNVSPETVGCACCRNAVPEINASTCQRREGLVPKTLRPILEKRARYKSLMQEAGSKKERGVYDRRQCAIKWMLVTCFGYLGYKNARFGKIEAHESVTAYGREKLLQAKEVAEARGFALIHALTDSLWVKKKGATETEYEALREEMARATGLPIGLEGVYLWIAFLPSKVSPKRPVPNRFVGVFTDGRVKIRGIEMRRSDMPPFVKKAQAEIVRLLSEAGSVEEIKAKVDDALEVLSGYLAELREGGVPLHELVIRKRLSKDPLSYKKKSILAEVAGELVSRGVALRPGEKVDYVITDFEGRSGGPRARAYATMDESCGYDVGKYTDLLLEAAGTMLAPFGYDYQRLVEIAPLSA